jgi:hypothetical protein
MYPGKILHLHTNSIDMEHGFILLKPCILNANVAQEIFQAYLLHSAWTKDILHICIQALGCAAFSHCKTVKHYTEGIPKSPTQEQKKRFTEIRSKGNCGYKISL